MNRHRALGAMNDRNKRAGSGEEERLRRTKSNNSLNPTGNSMAFIRKIEGLIQFFPAG
jgi:hypothetical protein